MKNHNEQYQDEIILIMTTKGGAEREIIVSTNADNFKMKVNPGETYRFVQRVNDQLIPLENIMALRSGSDLILRFGPDQSIVLADYFVVCAEGECEALLAIDSVDMDEYFILPADSLGLELEDGRGLILAKGDSETLLQMANAEPFLVQALQTAQQSKPMIGELFAEAQDSAVVVEEEDYDLVSAFVLLAGAATALIVVGSGGSSSGASLTPIEKIEAYNNGDGVFPRGLSVDDYVKAEVTGVTEDNLGAVNAQVLAAEPGGADTVEEVQNLVTAANHSLSKIERFSSGDGVNPPGLTVKDYTDAGIMGVT